MLDVEESPCVCIAEVDQVCTDFKPAEEDHNASKLAEGSHHRELVHRCCR